MFPPLNDSTGSLRKVFPISIGEHHQVWKDLVLWTLSDRAEDTVIQEDGKRLDHK